MRLDGLSSAFASEANTLVIPSREAIPPGRKVVEVFYRGTPADGLFFDESLNSVPAAFADNWPNRARWWFPANDHPSDKATVTFTVRTQPTLRVVANGAVADSAGGIWRWTTAVPIPSYTMVIGVAPFQRAVLGRAACGRAPAAANGCVEVSVWGLPGDSAFAVRRFARAVDMVEFYAERVGPFPYEKLAHVQSTSRFGGMENASAIFYAREPWSRGTMGEGVIAHETAHQWFGDSVTEYEWHDLWLSEGFASYFGPLYFESRDGPAAFSRLMASAKESYLGSQVVGRPIVGLPPDRDLFSLLNENNYEKAAWVLHMLRKTLGDSTFFSGVRRYYDEYRNGSATTADFRRIMEEVGAQDLGWFFDQWLHHPGYPQLDAEWSTRPLGGQYEVQLVLRQQQAVEWPTFRLPLDLVLRGANGTEELHRIDAVSRTDTFRIRTMAPVSSLAIDPNEWVLKTLQLRSP
ncbi:MAG: M1 family metallopeptidase [Gemmatimonadetes bacterium]|nr:M1 family metallopeptidase [Gemmatimonadota bacterium]